ncbi:hypothetical protein ABPG77_005316 [Micractinium sp. CCAP 211/92]
MGVKQQQKRGRAGFSSGLRWLAIMSTAVLLAVIITHEPARPPHSERRHGRRLISAGSAAGAAAGATSDEAASWAAATANGAAEAAGGRTAAAAFGSGGTTLQAGGGGATGARFASRDECVTAATAGPIPVHGRVQKAGPLPMHLLDGPNTTQRHRAYFAWRDFGTQEERTQEWMVDGKLMRVGSPPPLFPYCRILVNHAYRTMYLKAPKTGSTSLLTLMGTCTGNAATDKPTCFKPLEVMASEEEYQRMYGSYFVFAVVRNPWARAVSSYRMLSRYLRHGCKELVGGWNRVCTDANLLPLVHNQHPLCTISKQQGEGFAMHHLIPQAPCLVTATGDWAADYVVRTENLAEDMKEVWQEMNAHRLPGTPELDVESLLGQLTNVNKVHVACRGIPRNATATAAWRNSRALALPCRRRRTLGDKPRVVHLEAPESYCAIQMYYQGQHSLCFDALAAYYQDDVRLFGLPTCR